MTMKKHTEPPPSHPHLEVAWRVFADRIERIRAEAQEIAARKKNDNA